MEIAINEAKGKLSSLIRRATSGEQVFLTSHGKPVAEIRPLIQHLTLEEKMKAIRQAQTDFRGDTDIKAASADSFLYDDDTGLPS